MKAPEPYAEKLHRLAERLNLALADFEDFGDDLDWSDAGEFYTALSYAFHLVNRETIRRGGRELPVYVNRTEKIPAIPFSGHGKGATS